MRKIRQGGTFPQVVDCPLRKSPQYVGAWFPACLKTTNVPPRGARGVAPAWGEYVVFYVVERLARVKHS